MKYDPNKHHPTGTLRSRRSIRLKGYDYTQVGAYFVTMCTQGRDCLFGEIMDGEMRLSDFGKIVQEEWLQTAQVRSNIELDEFVIMPNHFHGILVIMDGVANNVGANRVGAQRRCAPTETHPNVVPGSVGAIVRSFKSVVTRRVNEMHNTPGAPVWQRNYYEHIIRDEKELNRIREYIIHNPANWDADEENPKNTKDAKR